MPAAELSTPAKHDVAEVVVSLTRRSAGAAQRFRADVDRARRIIGGSPRIGRPREDLRAGLRCYSGLTPWLVFYRVTDDGALIERVIHGARRIDPSMFE